MKFYYKHACMFFFHDSSLVDKQFESCMAVFPTGIYAYTNLAIRNLRIKYYLYGASYEFDIKPPTCTSYTPDSLQNVEIKIICEDNKGKSLYNIMLLLLIIQQRCELLPIYWFPDSRQFKYKYHHLRIMFQIFVEEIFAIILICKCFKTENLSILN